MAIGLNAVRAICLRCPLAMAEDLLRDLTLYKLYKKEKSVMMAARSLITLYREQLPSLLHKKDRGRLTIAQAELKPKLFGETIVYDNVPGAEALLKSAKSVNIENDSDSNSDGWIDVNESGDGITNISDSDSETDGLSSDEQSDEDEINDSQDEASESDSEVKTETSLTKNEKHSQHKIPSETVAGLQANANGRSVETLNETQAAREIAMTRVFTDEDFVRIDAQNIKKLLTNARKRPLEAEKSEYVKLNDIEMIFKKRRNDKNMRLESIMKGRENREKFGYRDKRKNIHCSRTNAEKEKKKNFGMMRQKARSKVKKSFKDKQQALRKHLLRQKKMK